VGEKEEGTGLSTGLILSVQSNQFSAAHEAIRAVADEKLCSQEINKINKSEVK